MQGTPRQTKIMQPLSGKVSTRLWNRTYEAVGKLDDRAATLLVEAIAAELEAKKDGD